jgi:hypothetical protein
MSNLLYAPFKTTFEPSYKTCDKCYKRLGMYEHHDCRKCVDCGYTVDVARMKGIRCAHRFTFKTQEDLSQNNDSQPKTKYMYSCYPRYGLLPPPYDM